nr:hypothetical protein Q903MT_gene339 [Picea sitchensis]
MENSMPTDTCQVHVIRMALYALWKQYSHYHPPPIKSVCTCPHRDHVFYKQHKLDTCIYNTTEHRLIRAHMENTQ